MGNLIEGKTKSNQKNTCIHEKDIMGCTHPKIKKHWLFGKRCIELTKHRDCPHYQGKPKYNPLPAPQTKK